MGADYAARSTGGLNGPDSFSQRLISSIHFGPNEGEKVSATGDFTTLSPGSTGLYVSLDRCPANFAVRDRWLPDSRPPCPLHLLSRSCVMRLKNPECSMAPDSDLQVHDADTSDTVLVRYACRVHLSPGLCASCIISRPPQGTVSPLPVHLHSGHRPRCSPLSASSQKIPPALATPATTSAITRR